MSPLNLQQTFFASGEKVYQTQETEMLSESICFFEITDVNQYTVSHIYLGITL